MFLFKSDFVADSLGVKSRCRLFLEQRSEIMRAFTLICVQMFCDRQPGLDQGESIVKDFAVQHKPMRV